MSCYKADCVTSSKVALGDFIPQTGRSVWDKRTLETGFLSSDTYLLRHILIMNEWFQWGHVISSKPTEVTFGDKGMYTFLMCSF